MKKKSMKAFCILLIVFLTANILLQLSPVFASSSKMYIGPKEVYSESKDKPPGTPDKPGKPDNPSGKPNEPNPDPTVDKWAVIIGISDYRGKINDLNYCDDDARDVYTYLISIGYPEGNIKLLIDKTATAKNIMKAIEWLDSMEGSDSEVVFYFSGHGSTYDGYDDGDSEYTDEAIVSSDLYLILDGQLTQKFSTFESNKIAFIFDTCYSGGMNDLAETSRIVVAACSETELSYDGSYSQQNGVFTFYYIEGLYLYNTVEGAFNYASPKASNFISDYYGAYMNPQIFDQYVDNWAF